jgi:hypothetical protein
MPTTQPEGRDGHTYNAQHLEQDPQTRAGLYVEMTQAVISSLEAGSHCRRLPCLADHPFLSYIACPLTQGLIIPST